MEKKKFVDYVWLVGFYGLSDPFLTFCQLHSKLSLRRAARSFLISNGYYKELMRLRHEGMSSIDLYMSRNNLTDLDRVIKIAKTPWLDDKL